MLNIKEGLRMCFDPELEERFKDDYFDKSIVLARIGMVLGIILYSLFGILDIWIVPQSKHIVWLIRFAFVVPLLVILLTLSFFKIYKHIMQWVQFVLTLFLGLGIIAMIWIARPDELGHDFYFPGLLLVIVWAYTISRLRFRYATASSWVVTAAFFGVLIFRQDAMQGGMQGRDLPLLINNGFFFIGANILGMFAWLLPGIQYETQLPANIPNGAF